MQRKLRLAPSFGYHFRDLPVGHARQSREHLAQVGVRVQTASAATFDEGINNRAAFAGSGIAHEQPVLLAAGGGPDGIFHQVVVNLHPAVIQINGQRGPLAQGIIHSLPQQTLRQVSSAGFEPNQGALDSLYDGAALTGTHGLAQPGTGAVFAQACFDAVEVLDLPDDPTGGARRLLKGFIKLPAHMRPAAGQFNRPATTVGKRPIVGDPNSCQHARSTVTSAEAALWTMVCNNRSTRGKQAQQFVNLCGFFRLVR